MGSRRRARLKWSVPPSRARRGLGTMTTTHSESPPAARPRGPGRGDAVALTKRRRRQQDWTQRVAQVLCMALAAVGTLPFLATLIVRSAWARDWAARTSRRLLETQRIEATFAPSLRVWPLALELDHVRVDSADGGGPALECRRILVRPKLFALLAGKVAIDTVDLDSPKLRVVVRDGKVTNLALP